MGTLSGGRGAAAIVAAAGGIANDRISLLGRNGNVAVMRFTNTACMRRSADSSHHERKKISREREEQQQSGGQAMHDFVRIEPQSLVAATMQSA
jgi:hypothetical protein